MLSARPQPSLPDPRDPSVQPLNDKLPEDVLRLQDMAINAKLNFRQAFSLLENYERLCDENSCKAICRLVCAHSRNHELSDTQRDTLGRVLSTYKVPGWTGAFDIVPV